MRRLVYSVTKLDSLELNYATRPFDSNTLLELSDSRYQLIRKSLGRRDTFYLHIQTLTHYLYFEDSDSLMDFMMKGLDLGPYANVNKSACGKSNPGDDGGFSVAAEAGRSVPACTVIQEHNSPTTDPV
jgi:hypothetical protein